MAKGERIYKKALELARSNNADKGAVLNLLRRSSELGNAEAKYAIASWYLHGVEVEQNYEKAIELLIEVCESGGVPEAHLDLAYSYESGSGVEKDEVKAFNHYLMSALLGSDEGLKELGRCLYYGIGCQKNKNVWHWISRLVGSVSL